MRDSGNNENIMSYKEKEMRRMCGAVPADTINGLKADMKGFIDASFESIKKLEQTYPEPFDHHGYKDKHNHLELEGNMTEAANNGFYGATLIVSDIKNLDEKEVKQVPLSEIIPPVLLNDLVVRTTTKLDDGRKKRYYEIHKYDPDTGLFTYSQYEFRFAAQKEVDRSKAAPLIANKKFVTSTETIPAHIELVQSAAFPLRWVLSMLITGMWGKWADMSFYDFPVLFTWYEDKPYKLYRDFAKENLTTDEEHAIIEDVLEASIGFQRYLIKLTENREKVKIKREKSAPSTPQTKQEKPIVKDSDVKHVISLDTDIRIYTTGKDAVKKFRHPQKCMYRYSVRGHYRHYKNGKVVWIKSYDKNADKPFYSHKYGA